MAIHIQAVVAVLLMAAEGHACIVVAPDHSPFAKAVEELVVSERLRARVELQQLLGLGDEPAEPAIGLVAPIETLMQQHLELI
ncbi:MAG: hypothetical protein DBP00_00400, partial [gamma proteobacterium symbiont of Ctena orbiculata]